MLKFLRFGANLARSSTFVPKQSRFFSTPQHIFDVNSVEDFNEKVLQASTPVIVDFHAEWCGPCQILGPKLEEKINGREGEIAMAKINVDYAGELAMDYEISVVPTVLAFKDGEKIGSFTGLIEDEQLDDFINDAISA
ncbi:unnamed protein product [Caenorhabditis angaria]|uniref:Thioredoxin domain-containing protein n=1 Tax=Caenorhabditis angaria TaxID=860376 RepID=A0A9P1IRY0_9PELO|nr:unnamed protein product [Caenorhabditis angaria]